jgi:hypothetical protein
MATRVLSHTSNDVTRAIKKTGSIAAATTLTEADSGTTYIIPAATAGAAITLPTLKAGLWFKFIINGAFAATDWTIVSSTDVIEGTAIVKGAEILGTTENTVSFVASAETVGDFAQFVCDGVNWFVFGVAGATGGLTFTKP